MTANSNLFKLSQGIASVLQVSRYSRFAHMAFDLPEDFDSFLESQSNQWKSAYRGHLRLMALSGNAEFRVSTQPDQVASALQSLAQINSAQQRKINKDMCVFDSDDYLAFYEDVCLHFSRQEKLRVVSLIIDGRLLASASFFSEADVLYASQMGSVRGDGIRFLPLFVLMVWVIKKAISQGYKRIEFPSDYIRYSGIKDGCTGQQQDLLTLEWYKSRLRAYMSNSVRNLYIALKSS